MRDLAVHGNDLVAATYGRALWVLDDLSPLRQASTQIAASKAALLRPLPLSASAGTTIRKLPSLRKFPPGKILPKAPSLLLPDPLPHPLALEIHDAQGNLVRRFYSVRLPWTPLPKMFRIIGLGRQAFSKNAGLNRFVWDLRYAPPHALNFSYYGGRSITSNILSPETRSPASPRAKKLPARIAVPGQYEVFFVGNGTVMKQPLTITLDPRVHVSQADLEAQLLAGKRIDAGLAASTKAFQSITNLRAAIADRMKTLGVPLAEKPASRFSEQSGAPKEKTAEEKAQEEKAAAANPQTKASADALRDLDKKAAAILEGTFEAPGVGPINRDLARTAFFIDSGDAAPSQTAQAVLDDSCSELNKNLAAWRDLDSQAVPATNTIIAKSSLAALPTATVMSITAVPHDGGSTDACAP